MQRIVIAAALAVVWVGSGYALLSGKVSPKAEREAARQPATQTMVMQPVAPMEPADDPIAKTIQAMEPKAPVPAAPKAKTAVVVPRPTASLPAEKRRASER